MQGTSIGRPQRVDVDTTEAEFIMFRFADEETAQKAERLFPTDFAHTQRATLEYRANSRVAGIRERLEAAGIEWTESESSLTEDEMWPDWPDDRDEDEDVPSANAP